MINTPSLQELLEAGVHFGHQVRRGHPRMRPYIYGARDGVHIIDLTLSEKYLKDACKFVYDLGKDGGVLLLVGTKKQARGIVEELAKRVGIPFLSQRWIGGFLTNFEEIQKNIKKMKDLKNQKEKGELSKYTKKEQLLLDRKMIKLERDLGGTSDMAVLPDALFVIDAVTDEVAVKEANRKNIKVVAIADSNSDPSQIDYPIPGNDDAIKSIKILTETIVAAYEEGKKEGVKEADKANKKAEQDAKAKEEQIDIPEEDVAVAEELVEKEAVKEAERKVE